MDKATQNVEIDVV